MLDRVTDRPLVRVLKVGCGTARNLRVLARKVPHNSLYGIDACLAMFATAREALDKRRRPSLQFCYGRLTIRFLRYNPAVTSHEYTMCGSEPMGPTPVHCGGSARSPP